MADLLNLKKWVGCWWITSRSGWLLELLTELTKTKKDSKTKPNSNQGHGGWVGWLGTQQSAHRNLTPVHSGQSCEQFGGVKVCNIIFSLVYYLSTLYLCLSLLLV